ncbi:hypothetical protein ES705_22280 [subsurface metagenome]
MKKIASLSKVGVILCLLYSTVLFAQTLDTLWTKTYGGIEWDFGFSVQQTTDNGYIITGYTKSFGVGSNDVYLVKTDINGDTLWTKTYGGISSDKGWSVQQTTDNGYIITGCTMSFGPGGEDFYLIKTDANGDTLWTRAYGGPGIYDYGYSVQQTTDNGYIIVGYTNSFGAGNYDVYLVKTDKNGDTLWTKTYGGTAYDVGWSVQQTADNGYIITGWTSSFGAGGYDVYLIKTDENGDTLWTKTYGGPIYDYGRSIQQTTDNGYIIAGYTRSFGPTIDVYLIKTDSLGDTLWTRTYGETGNPSTHADKAFSVQQMPDDGYIIVGWTDSFGTGDDDVYLLKTDMNGDLLWTQVYGGPLDDRGYSIQQTTDNGYIIAGYTRSFGAGDYDVWLLRITGALFLVTPTGIDFGDVYVDSMKTDSVTVTNTGTATLDITAVVSDNAEFTVTPTTGNLAPAASMEFYITFAPTEPGAETGNIIFTHNAMTSPDTVTVIGTGVVGIEEAKDDGVPTVYALSRNYPNPFKTETAIHYQLPQPNVVTIVIYNVSGQRIRTLVNEHKDAGFYTVHWDGRSQDSQRVSNGVYFCRMVVGEYISVKKILLTR